MKVTYQIKTREFEFIMVERECDSHLEAVMEYEKLKGIYLAQNAPVEGLNRKEWNTLLDALNMGLQCDLSLWERASKKQQEFYHEQEKSIARIGKQQAGIIDPDEPNNDNGQKH